MGKTVNEIEQLERTLDKESITFKELKEGILKYKAKSEYQQAAIIIIRGVLEKRLHENSGLHKHFVTNRTYKCSRCGTEYIPASGTVKAGCCIMPVDHRTSGICGGELIEVI